MAADQKGLAGHLEYLDAMGIQVWRRRELPREQTVEETVDAGAESVENPAAVPQVAIESQEALSDWQTLEQQVTGCTRCELHQTRTQAVFGVGNKQADWLIIGEAPGADEDRLGEPFVGRAGKLLDQMLLAIGLSRETVYIANILKCRPPNNRDPKSEEVACCDAYLKRQIELIQPKIILTVGRIASQNLLKTEERIGAMRGRRFEYADTGIPVVVTYHPAYLLRAPSEKRKTWQDLLLARQVMAESSPAD